ncbi:hypothetical protein KGQ25_00605 [Patescibacteria group bacterium]|nr:hypothetical protein [Patescibacteria group bacterium]MDE2021316.1 hypothetical protein [Patescibacteria group bacterium]MDE2173026.1 hypothetical protein [Patescibacteria group bacterium]
MNSRALSLLALFISVGIFFAYIRPVWTGEIALTKDAIANDDQALSAASAYAAQQSQLIAARDAINPTDLARLTNFLPDSVDNVGIILDLNALAARSGFALSNIDVSKDALGSSGVPQSTLAAGANPVDSVDLSVSAAGTYASFKAFLQGVEKSQRLLDIQDLVVKGSDTGIYSYQMTIRLYWLR